VIITYLRSSSYNTFDFCQHKYYLDYCLDFRSPANKKAQKGTIVHKALEILAKLKLAKQEGKDNVYDEELNEHFNIGSCTPDIAIELVFWHYRAKKEYEYEEKDLNDCKKWLSEALLWKNGMFSPLKMNILSPEQYFDFEIKQPWAFYKYTLEDGTKLEGYLAIKGTLDLVVERDKNTIEVVDWKTGVRINWNTKKPKEYEDFYNDPQLLLYYYAAHKLYPKIKHIFLTIFWLQDGGPFTICFQPKDLKRTENLIKDRFISIKRTDKPKLIYPHFKCNWCHFKKNSFNGPTNDYNESICKTVKDEVIELGIDKVTALRGKSITFNKYGAGGGKDGV
jgi:hypothetical protein